MSRIKIAIVFDIKEDYGIDSTNFDYCDFSDLSNVEYIKEQLEYEGYEVNLINPPGNFFEIVKTRDYKQTFDMVFNMSEGFQSRNREILVPILCEALHIPYIGSDAFSLSFTNHKFQTKLFAKQLGIHTADDLYFDYKIHSFQYLREFFVANHSWFPVIIKPNREGSSMGLRKVNDINGLINAIDELIELYNQEILIEKYIDGPDILSFIIGTGMDTEVYPLVEVTDKSGDHLELWNTELKHKDACYVNACIPRHTIKIIKEQALLFHRALQLYDLSRIDWRVDEKGTPFFLESTPLPALGADFSCSAKAAGLNFHELMGIVIKAAIKRLEKT